MFLDDDLPKKISDAPVARMLKPLSVSMMRDYIAWLNAETARVEQEIIEREAIKSSAELLFKS